MKGATDIIVQETKRVIHREGKYLTFSLDIEDKPKFGVDLNTDYILGVAKAAGGIKILLDIDRVLTRDELRLLENAA